MNSLISIIIPVYNTSRYLRKCVDSILNQTYKNIEVILVDDGSTDDSPIICDEYASADSRVKVVHQQNTGLVGARKKGIEVCTGDYIMHVDSDDWINLDTCEKLVGKAIELNADIVFCDIIVITNNNSFILNSEFNEDPLKLLHSMMSWKFPWSTVNKLTRRSTAIESIKNSTPGDDIAEDMLMTLTSLMTNPQIAYIPEALYNYNRIVESSLMMDLHTDCKLYYGRNNIKKMYELLVQHNLFDEFRDDFNRFVFNIKLYLLREVRIADAREFYPFAHKDKHLYKCLPKSIRWIYYGALRWGIVGELLFQLYVVLKRPFISKKQIQNQTTI